MRNDDLSTQEEVNQLMVQFQELQDKVNSLNDAKTFYDHDNSKLLTYNF